MVYIRILFVFFMALYVFYYALILGHLLNFWKITNEKIKFHKLIIPFYYFTKLS